MASATAAQPAAGEQNDQYDAKGFWALIVTMFQGAFNDNAYRWVLFYYLAQRFADPELGRATEQVASRLLAFGLLFFAVPFLVFPGLAGALADRYSKRTITIATKWWEVAVMLVGLFAFYTDNVWFMGLMFFMMNTQSAFFSPAKYGILPEMLPESRLSWGNGVLQMGTFVAIILGTAVAGPLMQMNINIYLISLFLITCSVLGLIASQFVTPVPAASPGRFVSVNPWSGLGVYFKTFWGDHLLFLTLLGGGFFWFLGALAQSNVAVLGESVLGLTETQISILSLAMALGIGLGSLAAGYLSRRRIELGLVPIGVTGMAVCGILLGVPLHSVVIIGLLMFVFGSSGGFFHVPLAATLQHRLSLIHI